MESVGMTRQALTYHMNLDPEFAAEVEEAEIRGDEEVEDGLRESAIAGNVTASIFWLCNRRPERWHHVQRQEVTGQGGGPIKVDTGLEAVRDILSDPQARAALDTLAQRLESHASSNGSQIQ